MKNSSKKFLSLALCFALMMNFTACSSKSNETSGESATATPTTEAAATEAPTQEATEATPTETAESTESEVVKPEQITVMMDGTVFTEPNGRAAFEEKLEENLGIDIVFNQPDHSGYYDVVSQTFVGGDWPDVILLGAAYYATYASAGALADITDLWENSELKASGRIVNEDLIEGLKIDGTLYGFSPARGNGCITYIRKAWLDQVGLEAPTTYDEYLNMLKVFTENDMDGSGDPSNTYGVTAAGLIGNEAPYINYLPEFYQDAYPDFYKNDQGVWVDGFSEDAMAGALSRLKEAYEAGYIDKETITNGTKDCRNKFYDNKVGVFTYWAGTWASNLVDNLDANGLESDLVMLPPIAEVGTYIERQAPVWCITSKCENVEGVFKYFIETMLDGGDVQTLWTYGAEGTHWSTAAETVTYGDNSVTYEEGQFHMLPSLEQPDTLLKKNHIDPMLSLATFINGDPGVDNITPLARESAEDFNEWSELAPVIVANDTISDYSGDLWDLRNKVITQVVTQGMSVEEGMQLYKDGSASMVEEILASLND